MKLKNLTKEQKDLMIVVRDEWTNKVFSCKTQLNKKEAEKGINWIYEMSGLKNPAIIWLKSPLGLQYCANLFFNRASVGSSVEDSVWNSVVEPIRDYVGDSVSDPVWNYAKNHIRASTRASFGSSVGTSVRASVETSVRTFVWDSVRDSVWDSVGTSVRNSVWTSVGTSVGNSVGNSVGEPIRASVGNSVWTSVRASVGDSVRASVGNSVWDSVRASVGSSVGNSVGDPIRASVGSSVGNSGLRFYDFTTYGSISDYGWVSFYDYFHRINIVDHDNFKNFKDFLNSGVYDMITLDGLCLVSEMPVKISRDNKGNLHSENSSCIEWSDGFKLWKWKGFDVPKKLIEAPESITSEDLKNNRNAEVRRAFIEKLGVNKYFEILSNGKGLDILDEDIDNQGNPMRLMSFLFGIDRIQVLECQCPSTGRIYNIYPPSQNCKNVWEAKADTFNISEKQIKQLTQES